MARVVAAWAGTVPASRPRRFATGPGLSGREMAAGPGAINALEGGVRGEGVHRRFEFSSPPQGGAQLALSRLG